MCGLNPSLEDFSWTDIPDSETQLQLQRVLLSSFFDIFYFYFLVFFFTLFFSFWFLVFEK